MRLKVAGIGITALVIIALAGWRTEESEIAAPIPPPVTTTRSTRMAKGWEIILKAGTPGEARARIRTTSWWGIRNRTVELSRTVTRTPNPELRMIGTAKANAVNAPRITRVIRSKKMEATGYDPGPHTNSWEYAGTTKLGWRTRKGIVAVDPKVIPLRSLLYIEGYGLAWAGDVGGAIKGDRIDLCFNRTEDALRWGRRTVTVHVLAEVRNRKSP
jgi:3D (Asp-Asp-Asp) domain-containing protein